MMEPMNVARYRKKVLRKVLLLNLVLGSVTMVLFQNCSNANLTKVEDPVTLASHSDKAFACGMTSQDTSPPKYVFIVDMSGSNLGEWKKRATANGMESFWDDTNASDANGDRLTLIKDFLNGSQDTDPNFAVIGFSWDRAGATERESTVGFVNKSTAMTRIEGLLTEQNGTVDNLGNIIPGAKDLFSCFKNQSYQDALSVDPVSCPNRGYTMKRCGPVGQELRECNYQMHETGYVRALDLARKFIYDDIYAKGSKTKNYYTFFISDGVPKDDLNPSAPADATRCKPSATDPNAEINCQRAKIFEVLRQTRSSMSSAPSYARNLFLYGLFYSPPPPACQDSDSDGVCDGETFMRSMVDEAKNGKFFSLQRFTGALGGNFFENIVSSSTVYEPFNLQAIPLTTVVKNGKLHADSDMDGVIDSEEVAPLSPQNPRSNPNGILDGLYLMLKAQGKLGLLSCTDAEKVVSEAAPSPNYTGLSVCDMKALNIDVVSTIANKLTPGLDTDKDGLIDLVEVLKFLNPGVSDSAQDLDNDSLITLREVLRGSDPFVPDFQFPLEWTNLYSIQSAPADSCPAGSSKSYGLMLERIPVTTTKATSKGTEIPSYLRHDENEGIVYVGYSLVSTSSSTTGTLPAIYKGQFVRVRYLANGDYQLVSGFGNFLTLGER